jgi:phosphoenolpyruvate synthase/pyruvate phosphate dikinase
MKHTVLKRLKNNGFPVPDFLVVKPNSKLIVRSSANIEDGKHSWAGIFESYITKPKEIELVGKSATSPKAKLYAEKIGYKSKVEMNVIIQEAIEGLVGVCFTDKMLFEPDPKNKELIKICKQVEQFIGRPQDIEWVIDKKGKIWILQSRDIS